MHRSPTRPEEARTATCSRLMVELERELRRVALWSEQPPQARAFQSTLPFCADRMDFGQWLQWVFIPRTRALLERGGPLPAHSGIRPMAEEMLREAPFDPLPLLALLGDFDRLINQGTK